MTDPRISAMSRALRRARGWLAMIAQEHGRPETSDIHAVLAEVDAAIAMEARQGGNEVPSRSDDSADRSEAEVSPK